MELISKAIVFPDVPHEGELGVVFHDAKRTTYAEIWEIYCDEWCETAASYETDPSDFCNAWNYLNGHPAFWRFRHGPAEATPLPLSERLHVRNLIHEYGINHCVDIMVVKVNAETRSTEDGPPLETEVWIELGQQSWPVEHNPSDPETYDRKYHDHLLDCGGPTVEAAILRAAHNVWEVYGNDRRVCDAPHNEMAYITVVDSGYFDELMKDHGDDGEINERVRRASQRLNEIVGRNNEPGKRKQQG